MRYALTAFAALAAASAISATPAAADILTFDGGICSGSNCSNFGVIDQSYGDTTGLDVIWAGNNGTNGGFSFWDNGYSNLTNVGFGYGSDGVEIYLKPLAGYQITLVGFDIGSWLADRTSSVRVLSGDLGTTFTNTGNFTVSGSTASHFGYNETRTDGFRIRFGPDNYNVGIDNIEFRVSEVGPGGPVPEPGAWALMITGFGAAGAMLRRRRTATAAG